VESFEGMETEKVEFDAVLQSLLRIYSYMSYQWLGATKNG
jgi:hypothetical protein